MSATTLYKNYRVNKKAVETRLASQISLRYQTPADCPEHNITGIKYFLSLDQLLHISFYKNVQTSVMVFLACFKFLAKVGKKPRLMNHARITCRTASLLIEGYRPPGTPATKPSPTTPTRQVPDHKAKGTTYPTIRQSPDAP